MFLNLESNHVLPPHGGIQKSQKCPNSKGRKRKLETFLRRDGGEGGGAMGPEGPHGPWGEVGGAGGERAMSKPQVDHI